MSEKKDAGARTRDLKPFGLRLPPEIKRAVEAAARVKGCSLNAEIVARLQGDSQLDRIEAAIARLTPQAFEAVEDDGPRGNRVPIMFSDSELAEIDEWRFANRVATRARAVRELVTASIRA